MIPEAAGLFSEAEINRAKYAENTRKGYKNDWALFSRWCLTGEHSTLPASTETVRLYLISLLRSGRKISTAERRLSAIAHYHREGGIDCAAMRRDASELLNMARRHRPEQPRQMSPLLVGDLRKISRLLCRDGSDKAVRDRALLVLGLGSALRRCNLAGLTLSDVQFRPEGVLLTVRKEKNDQLGRGRVIGLPRGTHADTCPVRSLRAWLRVRGALAGPLFTKIGGMRPMSAAEVAKVVKASVSLIGLDPTQYAGHSLRAGFVTAAGESGASELVIAAQTGHRNMAILRRYFRHHDVWRSNACGMIGL